MGRQKLHASDAERQRAYRSRRGGTPLTQSKSKQGPRRPSRPVRFAAVQAAVLELFDEYEDWLASMPESLQESGQAHKLSETVDQLAAIIDMLGEIELPRGFGRD